MGHKALRYQENCWLEIKTASLSGGLATIRRHLAPGTPVQLRLEIGMPHPQATARMREYRAQDMAFEIVDMNLEERSKYRRLLASQLSPKAFEWESPRVRADVAAGK